MELKFNQKKQNIKVFLDVLSEEDCERKILLNKEKAFGVISNVKRLFDKNSKIVITHKEKKYYPFWHVKAESFIEYKRGNSYSFGVEPQVRTVTVAGRKYDVSDDAPICTIPAEDYCIENYTKEIVTDATEAGTKDKKLIGYLNHDSKKVRQTEELMGRNKVVFPATVRGAFIVRGLFKDLLKPVHADKILTEKVEITEMCLYFRPAYAFELTKVPGGKTAALEIDALTGEMKKSSVIKQELKELIPENVLFELGAEAAAMIIPGAAAAALIGKQFHERKKKKAAVKQMRASQSALAKSRSKPNKRGRISLKKK